MEEPSLIHRQMHREATTIDSIGDDLLHNIFSRLPAPFCATVACVCRSWNLIATRILSYPKFSSALSRNPSLQDAVNEVIEEVLSQPIRPQFAIASVGPSFSLEDAHALISRRLDSRIPVISCTSQGIIGRDALTHEFQEVQWEIVDDDDDDNAEDVNMLQNANVGVLLSVGFLPGLKANLIPLLWNTRGTRGLMVDEFVMSIREYSSLVSGTTSPQGIILFADQETDMKDVLVKMDYAFSAETVIVGDGAGKFLYQIDNGVNATINQDCTPAALALVFAKDRDKPPGVGDTQLHVMLSNGISAFGPTYKAVSVRERRTGNTTWLTAKRGAEQEDLDGQTLLEQIFHEVGDYFHCQALFIGVMKRRKCSIGEEKVKWSTLQEFHEVLRGDEEYLYVNGLGIKSGDLFRFYISDSNTALSSCKKVSDNLRCLKQEYDCRNHASGDAVNIDKKAILGGISFCCCGRGESFFGHANADSLPFLENFPTVPLAGNFCAGEIARVDLSSYGDGPEELSSIRCCLHVFSTVYLVMSYTPAGPA
ncbi:F-box/LRR-repeat protein At5g63520 isoform X1 [Ipomoea triloba]|uniref:F-box/LRR-repeat protein At5g63520 isoform X1 n=1 Tax=Ipomoea triloba TaxID=35885 RepID=UPI00125D23B7|nr:F-box/LRR-repeat protein At5g63520 isoform X1 [Ipomoea triloba]